MFNCSCGNTSHFDAKKRFSHLVYEKYRFWPVCLFLWATKYVFLVNRLWHTVHKYGLVLSSGEQSMIPASGFTTKPLLEDDWMLCTLSWFVNTNLAFFLCNLTTAYLLHSLCCYLLYVAWNKWGDEKWTMLLAVPHYKCATPLIQQVTINVYHTTEHKLKIPNRMKFISHDHGSFQYYRLS